MTTAKVGLPVLAGALIVSAGIVALWMMGSASGERDKFSSLEIAPKQADAFFAINTDPTSPQWLAVNDSLGAVGAKDPIRKAIDDALAEVDLSWEDDIVPVAGDEAFFSVPSFDDVDGSSGFVAGFQVADEDKAQEVFDSLRERAADDGQTLEEEEYEGVTIYYTKFEPPDYQIDTGGDGDWFSYEPCPTDGTDGWVCSEGTTDFAQGIALQEGASSGAVALFDGVLALGGAPDDVKQVIDVAQGRAPSADENERLQEFRALQKDDFLMWGYADLASVWEKAEESLPVEMGTGQSESPVVATPAPQVTPQPRRAEFAVKSLDSEIIVDHRGKLNVTEKIVIDYGTAQVSGFYRDIPTQLPYDFEHYQLDTIEAVAVTRDGGPEDYEVTYDTPYSTIHIGSPNAPLAGVHTYTVQYTVVGGILVYTPGDAGFYQVTWDVTGDRWPVPVESASATVTLVSGKIDDYAACTVGVAATDVLNVFAKDGCRDEPPMEKSVTVRTQVPVQPGQGFGVQVAIDGPIDIEPPVLVERDSYNFGGVDFPSDDGTGDDGLPFQVDTQELFDQLKGTYDRVGFSVSSTSDGFAVDVTVLHADGFEPKYAAEPTEAFDSHFAESVPADTMFYFAGYDIYGQSWKPLKEYLQDVDFENGKTLDDYLGDFKDETGLDVEDDILSLLTGEYAVAGDVSDWQQDTPDFSILALMDVADGAKAGQTVADLADYAKRQDAYRVDDDGQVQLWNFTGEAELDDDIGVIVNGDRFIAGYPASHVEDAVAGFDESLANSEDWKKTVGLLPDDTTSIGYVSIGRILDEVQRLDDAERSLDEATDGEITFDNLKAIRALGFATTSIDNGFGMHFVVAVEQ